MKLNLTQMWPHCNIYCMHAIYFLHFKNNAKTIIYKVGTRPKVKPLVAFDFESFQENSLFLVFIFVRRVSNISLEIWIELFSVLCCSHYFTVPYL